MLSLEIPNQEIPKPGFLPDLNPHGECCLQAADEGKGAGTENHRSQCVSDCTSPAPLCFLAHICLSVILPVGVGREDKTLENEQDGYSGNSGKLGAGRMVGWRDTTLKEQCCPSALSSRQPLKPVEISSFVSVVLMLGKF